MTLKPHWQISHLSVFSMRFRKWTVPVPGFEMKVPYLGRVKERAMSQLSSPP